MSTLFVLGSGTMGSGIAQTGLQHGYDTVLCDVLPSQLERARAGIEKNLSRQVEKGRITAEDREVMLSRLRLTQNVEEAASADFVIEAIIEKPEAKKQAWKELSAFCRDDAILGTNTSTISISLIASAVQKPERFLGTHFFNPVPAMKLLELVQGHQTSPETIARAQAFAESIGKITILARDRGGFIANLMGSPMLNAAVNAYDRGVGSVEDIDKAMKYGWSMPMGPLELIDFVGVDVQLNVMEVLYEEYGEPYYKPAPLLKRMVDSGHLGRKSGRGFYDYTAKP